MANPPTPSPPAEVPLYRTPRIVAVNLNPPHPISPRQMLIRPAIRARILHSTWNHANQTNIYILSRLDIDNDAQVPRTALAALEDQLAVIDQPVHAVGDLLRVDVRRMQRGLGKGREPVYRFVGKLGEGFTRFEVLVVVGVSGVDAMMGYLCEVRVAEWERDGDWDGVGVVVVTTGRIAE